MSVVFGLYVAIPVLALVSNSLLAYWVHTSHSDVRGARWFVYTLSLGAVWMAVFLGSLVATDRWLVLVCTVLAYKVGTASFITWLLFASRYSRTDFHRHPLSILGFAVLGVDVLMPTLVEPIRSVWYASVTYATEPFTYVSLEPGAPYLVSILAMVVMVTVAIVSLSRHLLSTRRGAGTQVVLLIAGALPISALMVLGRFGVFPATDLNHAAYGVLPFSLFMTVALFRFQLFEVQPVARSTVYEALQDPVVVLDGDLAVLDYNRASTDVWPGIVDGVGDSVFAACPGLGSSLTVREGGVEVTDELRLEHSGGTRVYSPTVSAIRASGSGGTATYAVLLRDVTDLDQSRRQLQAQNERLEQVAATVSHDLRNPLNVADGFAEMLAELLEADDVDAEDRETARTYLAKVSRSTERMESIVEDVLRLAREGQAVEDATAVSLQTVAREAWGNVATEDAELTVVSERRVLADRSRLLTLLENVYRNAVEHGGPTVTVTVRDAPGRFVVADDGPGIDEADADAVFEYGYSTSTDGTGLGLSIVRTIAESHGWTVELDEIDDGTRFVFRNVETAPGGDRPAESPACHAGPDGPD